MAIKRPTLTGDVKTDQVIEDQPVNQLTPADLTSSDMLAEVDEPKYVSLKAPSGHVTQVPASLVDALVDSGYVKK